MSVQVLIDGVPYAPVGEKVKNCHTCVRDVQVCHNIVACVRNGHKQWTVRPSLKVL